MKQKKEWTQEQIEEAGKRIGNTIADYIFPALIIAAIWAVSIIYDIIFNHNKEDTWEGSFAALLIVCLYFTLIRCNKLEDKIEHIEDEAEDRKWNINGIIGMVIGFFCGAALVRFFLNIFFN